jgi:hypothetical protein
VTRIAILHDLLGQLGVTPDLDAQLRHFVEEVGVGRMRAFAVGQPPGPAGPPISLK